MGGVGPRERVAVKLLGVVVRLARLVAHRGFDRCGAIAIGVVVVDVEASSSARTRPLLLLLYSSGSSSSKRGIWKGANEVGGSGTSVILHDLEVRSEGGRVHRKGWGGSFGLSG